MMSGLDDVSRETFAKLEQYSDALRKWNPKINLVARSTLDNLWTRHFVDSAQLLRLSPPDAHHWADLGSGGGFPGLVIAIMAMERRPGLKVTLVESDHRKSAFLRSVLRETATTAHVISRRIEEVPPLNADVISARALADLTTLLDLSNMHISPEGVMIFPKGKNWQSELSKAQSKWRFDHEIARSETSDQSVILSISGVSRA